MRIGCFEVILKNASGETLEEVTVGTEVYAIATPNEEFAVHVAVYRDDSGEFPHPFLTGSLSVDKQSAGHVVWLRCSECLRDKCLGSFRGFRDMGNVFRSFTFSEPQANEKTASETKSEDLQAGTIQVKIFKSSDRPGFVQVGQ